MQIERGTLETICGEESLDWNTRRAIARAYWGVARPVTWLFLTSRTFALPLEAFHKTIPSRGKIVEVGCGHGVVSQYLARRGPQRSVIGYDPDRRRIRVAREGAKGVPNVEYRNEYFRSGLHADLAAIIVIGVFCLLCEAACAEILKAAHSSLGGDGMLLLSDVLLDDHEDWRYKFSLWRERWFARIGFTRGEGLFVRSSDSWKNMVMEAGFREIAKFDAPVPMHSVFNWICR